jgi:hypothetical protein
MKTRHLIALAVLVAAIGLFAVGCGFLDLGTSISTRIDDFVTSLNTDMTATYENLVPGSSIRTATTGDATFWEVWFPAAEGPYEYTILSTTPLSASGVEVQITSTVTTLSTTYLVVLQDTGEYYSDYYISDIQVDNGGTYTSIFSSL